MGRSKGVKTSVTYIVNSGAEARVLIQNMPVNKTRLFAHKS